MQTKVTREIKQVASWLASIPRAYLYAAVGAIWVLVIAVTVVTVLAQRSGDQSADSVAASSAAPTRGIATPKVLPTELPPPAEASRAGTSGDLDLPDPTATLQPAAPPLPTVTPTPELPPAAPRDVVISGSTTMRLSLSGEGFDSTGRPLSFEIAPRLTLIGGDTANATDAWCMQLGLVNEVFDLNLSLSPETEELLVTGSIVLREGFCEQPGEEMDRVAVNLAVPTDAAGQISYNLRGRRSLLGLSGLLDTDTGSIVELRVANSRPD